MCSLSHYIQESKYRNLQWRPLRLFKMYTLLTSHSFWSLFMSVTSPANRTTNRLTWSHLFVSSMIDSTTLSANTILHLVECCLTFFILIVRPWLITKLSTNIFVFLNTTKAHDRCNRLSEDAYFSMATGLLPLTFL